MSWKRKFEIMKLFLCKEDVETRKKTKKKKINERKQFKDVYFENFCAMHTRKVQSKALIVKQDKRALNAAEKIVSNLLK